VRGLDDGQEQTMNAALPATIECRWLVEPSLAMVALGLALVSAGAGWLWGGRGAGQAVSKAARLVGLGARIGMLAWLATAVAGVSWRPDDLPAGSSPGVLGASLTLPPVAWPGDSVAVEVTLATARIDPEDLVVEALIHEPSGAAPRRIPLALDAGPPSSSPLPAPASSLPQTATLLRYRGRAVLERTGRHRILARVVESTPSRTDRPLTRSGLIDVVEAPVSVLVIDSRPRFETRFLDHCLARDGRLEHHLHIQSRASSDAAAGRFTPESPLPTRREDWNRHDCIVLGAVEPDLAPEESWTSLAEAVSRDGLGLIWALDGRCDLEAIHASPLGRLAPVTGSCRPPDQPATRPLPVGPPAAGPIPWWLGWQPDEGQPDEGRADEGRAPGPWRGFGPVYDVFRAGRMRPTARIRAVFEGDDRSPAIVEDRLGRGRMIAFLSETWRWRATLGEADALGPALENAARSTDRSRPARVDAIWRRAILATAAPHIAEPPATPPDDIETDALSDDPAASARGLPSTEPTPAPPLLSPPAIDTPAGAGRPVWRHPLAIAVFLAIAAVEWWLRARGGLA
jgi:hypothetical protein